MGTGTAVMNKHCLWPCAFFCPPLYVLIYNLRHQCPLCTPILPMTGRETRTCVCSHGLTFLWAAVENGVWTHGSCQKWKLSFLCLKCHSAPSSANSRADKIGKANCRISRQHWASPPFAPTYPLSISLCLTREQGPVLSGHRHFPRAGPLPGFGRTRGLGWKVFPWRWNSNWNLMSSFSTL